MVLVDVGVMARNGWSYAQNTWASVLAHPSSAATETPNVGFSTSGQLADAACVYSQHDLTTLVVYVNNFSYLL